MNIGYAIKSIRIAQELSQIELARATGITQAAISNIENGARPGESTMERIAEALKTPVPVIYMLAMSRDDFDKKQQLAFDILEPVLRAMLMRFVG